MTRWFMLLTWSVCVGCPGPGETADTEANAQTTPAADSDSDSDGECDTDAGTDTDTDTDSDEDTDNDGALCGTDLGSETGWVVRAGQEAFAQNGGSCTPHPTSLDEAVYRWTAPASGVWFFSTNSFCDINPEILLYSSCGGGVADDNQNYPGLFGDGRIVRTLAAGESVVLGLRRELPRPLTPIGLHITLGSEESCDDGTDNDLDHATDCDDTDCANTLPCVGDTGF